MCLYTMPWSWVLLAHVYVASPCNMLKIFHYSHVGLILNGANLQVLVHNVDVSLYGQHIAYCSMYK